MLEYDRDMDGTRKGRCRECTQSGTREKPSEEVLAVTDSVVGGHEAG